MKIPNILDNSTYCNADLDYKWDGNTAEFYAVDAENEKFSLALWQLNHKATYALTTALCEWIYWRVAKQIDKPLVQMSLQAQWASIIDQHYSYDWNFSGEYISDPANGPIWAMLNILQTPRRNYYNGIYFINIEIDKLALLARHIVPNKSLFDHWLSDKLTKAAQFFPAQYDRNIMLANPKAYKDTYYNSFDEPAISRSFFFDENDSDITDNNGVRINQFLSSLDHQNNVLLNSPAEMLELGFVGTPYQYYSK